MKRVKYLFKKILGKDYKIKFVESKSNISGEDEKDFMSLSKALFKNVKDGDDKEIGKILNKTHPLYSDKSLMKLSDEKLSEKFNLDIKTIKKLRKFIEERIKHEGRG